MSASLLLLLSVLLVVCCCLVCRLCLSLQALSPPLVALPLFRHCAALPTVIWQPLLSSSAHCILLLTLLLLFGAVASPPDCPRACRWAACRLSARDSSMPRTPSSQRAAAPCSTPSTTSRPTPALQITNTPEVEKKTKRKETKIVVFKKSLFSLQVEAFWFCCLSLRFLT